MLTMGKLALCVYYVIMFAYFCQPIIAGDIPHKRTATAKYAKHNIATLSTNSDVKTWALNMYDADSGVVRYL